MLRAVLAILGSRLARPIGIAGVAASILLPSAAAAIGPIFVGCRGLPDCGRPPGNVIVSIILATFEILMAVAAGVTVVFVVLAGFQMLLTFGDESKVTKARMAILYALIGFGIALVAGSAVSFVATQYVGQGSAQGGAGTFVVMVLKSAVDVMVILFNALFLLMIAVAGIRMVMAQGKSDEFQKGMSIIKSAIFGAIVVNVAKALVQSFLLLSL